MSNNSHKILRSKVIDHDTFTQQIQSHLKELISYDQHMVLVRDGSAQVYPPPVALPDIDRAIRRMLQRDGTTKFVVDYELVDYLSITNGDEKALSNRKDELRQHIHKLEQEAIHKLLPMGKWRYKVLLYTQACTKSDDQRTENDNEVIAEHSKRLETLHKIHLYHADLESQIEDLNFDTINDWKPGIFAQ